MINHRNGINGVWPLVFVKNKAFLILFKTLVSHNFVITIGSSCVPPTPCLNGGVCVPGEGDAYSCHCATGYLGPHCEQGEMVVTTQHILASLQYNIGENKSLNAHAVTIYMLYLIGDSKTERRNLDMTQDLIHVVQHFV